jgi:septal ring factor EnvC (AmiA/AmiB activator)
MYVKIPGNQLVRDTGSMALINTDNNAKNEYYSKAKVLQTQKDEINKMKSELKEIKSDVSDIKTLLLQLIEKTNG